MNPFQSAIFHLNRLADLNEAGRVLSGANETKVRAAIAALQQILDALGSGTEPPAAQKESALAEARALYEAEFSFDQTRQLVQAAIKADVGGGQGTYVWVRDIFDNYAVYCVESDTAGTMPLFKRSYTIDDAGKVTLGDAVQVQAVTSYVPVSESGDPTPATESADIELAGDIVPLVEKALSKAPTARLKLISPGWGTSGYYSADVLKRDGPKAFKAGTHMYVDHPTVTEESERPERSIKDLAATLSTDAVYDANGADGPGLYAEAKVRSDFAPVLSEIADDIGVSIRALGKAPKGEAEGRKGPIVESIQVGRSVDFVTLPGRGGRVLELVEAARGRQQANPREGKQSMPELEEVQRALQESQAALATERSEREKLSTRLLLREARDFVATRIAAVKDLPTISAERLERALIQNPPVKDGALDEAVYLERVDAAIKDEQAYIASLTESGRVRGMGASAAPADGKEEDLTAALQALGLSESAAKSAAKGR